MPVTIEFFHDAICSFCFPMSYRMRQLKAMRPDVEVIHRSFALVRSERDFDRQFGSREAAKEEILSHWEHANANDDLHRFHIEGMRQTDFPFPTSMNALIACKAASFVAGEEGYWDVFDALQNTLFVQNRNIEDEDVIRECVRQTGIDLEAWQDHYHRAETLDAVEKDLALVEEYRIQSVPTLVINGQHRVGGAQPLERILRAVDRAMEKEEIQEATGGVCRLVNDTMVCEEQKNQ